MFLYNIALYIYGQLLFFVYIPIWSYVECDKSGMYIQILLSSPELTRRELLYSSIHWSSLQICESSSVPRSCLRTKSTSTAQEIISPQKSSQRFRTALSYRCATFSRTLPPVRYGHTAQTPLQPCLIIPGSATRAEPATVMQEVKASSYPCSINFWIQAIRWDCSFQ